MQSMGRRLQRIISHENQESVYRGITQDLLPSRKHNRIEGDDRLHYNT